MSRCLEMKDFLNRFFSDNILKKAGMQQDWFRRPRLEVMNNICLFHYFFFYKYDNSLLMPEVDYINLGLQLCQSLEVTLKVLSSLQLVFGCLLIPITPILSEGQLCVLIKLPHSVHMFLQCLRIICILQVNIVGFIDFHFYVGRDLVVFMISFILPLVGSCIMKFNSF